MIERINLIERQRLRFTYGKLMQICAVVLLMNVAVIASITFYIQWHLGGQMVILQTEVQNLQDENTLLAKQPKMIQKTVDIGELQPLFERLDHAPNWQRLIGEMTNALPSAVWMTQLQAKKSVMMSGDDPQMQNGSIVDTTQLHATTQNDSQFVYLPPLFEIKGTARDPRSIAEFSSRLSASQYFESIQIEQAIQQNYGYEFTIHAQVRNAYDE